MRDTAAYRPPVADRAVGDLAGDKAHHAVGNLGCLAVLDHGMGCAGADPQVITAILVLRKRFNSADLNHHVRLG